MWVCYCLDTFVQARDSNSIDFPFRQKTIIKSFSGKTITFCKRCCQLTSKTKGIGNLDLQFMKNGLQEEMGQIKKLDLEWI